MENNVHDKLLSRLIEIIKILVIAILIAWFIKEFIMFKAYVPTGSMKPAIMEKDQLIVSRIYKSINRGDIMVFEHNVSKDPLIKRVIGLPGDIVEVKNGIVFINGEVYNEPYVKYSENTNRIFNVPEDHYLFFGDNRERSEDARKWSDPYIATKKIKGKAILRIYPFSRVEMLKNV